MRGLAVLLMLQGHAFDSWLSPHYRQGEFFWLSQFLGGFPAPIFLFLVGASLAMVLDRKRQKGASPLDLARRVVSRGFWILLLAYAYRIEQYWIWRPASNWNDIFRVDTLNCIAVSSLVVGLVSAAFRTRKQNIVVMTILAGVAVFITPWMYSIRSGLPGLALDYLNGNSHSYYFSLFPWLSFTLVGIAFGYGLLEARSRNLEERFLSWVVAGGILSCAIGMAMPFFKIFEYGFFDYSLTSPHYFLVRIGWLSIVLYGVYRWCRLTPSSTWRPVQIFGQASLLVYWVHMELVYGKPFHELQRALDVTKVLRQYVWLVGAMFVLAVARHYGFLRLLRVAWSNALAVVANLRISRQPETN